MGNEHCRRELTEVDIKIAREKISDYENALHEARAKYVALEARRIARKDDDRP
jgi:hypothetical protein